MNGRRAFKAVYNDEGIERGNADRKGARIEGVELCSDLGHVKTPQHGLLVELLTLERCIHLLPVFWHVPML